MLIILAKESIHYGNLRFITYASEVNSHTDYPYILSTCYGHSPTPQYMDFRKYVSERNEPEAILKFRLITIKMCENNKLSEIGHHPS
jgi:hypothetical protein